VILIGVNAIQAVALFRLGAHPLEFVLFFGPELWRREVRPGFTLSLRAIPTGALLRAPEGMPGVPWSELPRGPALLIALLPLLTLALAGALLLGPSRFLDSFLGALPQLVGGALAPVEVGAPLVRGALGELQRGGLAPLVGVWCTKFLAFNLLPLPNGYLGQALLPLITPEPGPTPEETPAWPAQLNCLGGLLTVAFGLAWLAALGAALRG
tara:strand:+ start:688 stop:1320 length:633 start_codon:yes stop_codon:yes gene_type:complete